MPRLTGAEAVEAMRAAGLEPLEPYPGANTPWRCRHTCGREVSPTRHSVQRGQGGCGFCAGKAVDPEEAKAVMRAAGLEPLEPYPGNRPPWRCRCLTCGQDVRPRYANILGGQGGCGFCARNAVDPEEAKAVMRAAGLEPLEPYTRSHAPWRCRCRTCGREVSPRYETIQRGGGCGFCAGMAVDPEEAASVMRAAGLEPLVPYPGSHKPWRCRHTCGLEVSPRYANILRGQGPCRFCGQRLRWGHGDSPTAQ